MRSVIVTGGAGFIGSALVRLLIGQSDAQVLNIDKLTYAGNLASLLPVRNSERYQFIQADIADHSEMQKVVQQFKPDWILNLAAESHVDRSIDAAAPFIATNINGTFSMLEAARKYWQELPADEQEKFRFLHVSTDEVYGSLGPEGLFTEATAYNPRSPYSSSKAASDHLVKAWFHTYGMPTVVTNCSNNYGPYHFPEKLVPLTILNALDGKSLQVYGNGENIRDWLYVEDHAHALDLVARKGRPGETYNIGGNNERTNLQVVQAICELLDGMRPRNSGRYEELIEFVEDRAGHDKRYAIDAAKIRRELGWQPNENFDSGLKKTVQWYLDNREWWEPIRRERYSGQRLGVSRAQGNPGNGSRRGEIN